MMQIITEFFEELRRRHVFRVMIAYLAGSWLVIQVLETLFPIFGLDETSIRMVVVILAIGLIPAAVLSWIFEWTPAGLQRDDGVADESPARQQRTRNFDRLIIATLTIAVALFAIDEFVFDARSDAEWQAVVERTKAFTDSLPKTKASVAVLPFRNVSGDPDHAHFAYGLSEEVLSALAAIEDLKVSSSTSAIAIADKDMPIAEIAAILGVDHVLEGSVRRSGDRVRVTTSLVDANTDARLWVETFDRELSVDGIFDIQAGIAEQVAGALDLVLVGANASRGPADLRALDHYHDGLFYFRQMSPIRRDFEENFEEARAHFEAAVAIDPDWAPPVSMLGSLFHSGRDLADDPDEWLEISRGLIERALELDPAFGPAHGSLAYLLTFDGKYEEALQRYDYAILRGANLAHWGKAIALRVLGRHDEAIDEFLTAAAVDPLDEVGRFQLFETYYCAGRYDESIKGITRFVEVGPRFIYVRILLALAYAHAGDRETAGAMAEEIAAQIGDDAPLATVFALIGEEERASNALAAVLDDEPFIAVDAAPAAVLLGEPERAITMLKSAADFVASEFNRSDRKAWLWRLQCSPEIRDLGGNPRYDRLLERFGLAR